MAKKGRPFKVTEEDVKDREFIVATILDLLRRAAGGLKIASDQNLLCYQKNDSLLDEMRDYTSYGLARFGLTLLPYTTKFTDRWIVRIATHGLYKPDNLLRHEVRNESSKILRRLGWNILGWDIQPRKRNVCMAQKIYDNSLDAHKAVNEIEMGLGPAEELHIIAATTMREPESGEA